MKVPFVHNTTEGMECKSGLNWCYNQPATRLRLVLKVGPFYLYLRWRGPAVGGDRLIFDFMYWKKSLGGTWYDFNTMAYKIKNNYITVESLYELCSLEEGELLSLTKENGHLTVLSQSSDKPDLFF